MTAATIKKLEKAFMAGLSDRKACIFAGISHQTLYDYCKVHESFSDRKEQLKKMPSINAQMTIAKAIKKDPGMALKYLERKERKEWAPPTVKQEVRNMDDVTEVTDEQLDDELAALEAELAKRAQDGTKDEATE